MDEIQKTRADGRKAGTIPGAPATVDVVCEICRKPFPSDPGLAWLTICDACGLVTAEGDDPSPPATRHAA